MKKIGFLTIIIIAILTIIQFNNKSSDEVLQSWRRRSLYTLGWNRS